MAKALPIEDVRADTPFGVFAARVIEIRAGEAGAAASVHDRRVAIRRLRTALDVFSPALPKRARRVRRDLKRVASALGPARDAEVAVEALRGLEPQFAAADRPGFKGLLSALECEPPALDAAAIAGPADAARELAAEAEAAEPAAKALRRAAGQRLAAVRAGLSALDDPRDGDAVHRLRLAAKGLRYTLEAGAPALGPAAVDGAAAAKALQALLGDLHDADVLLTRIERHRRELRAEDVEAVCSGGSPRNGPRYRGVQTADTLVRAHRAGLRASATALRSPTVAALEATATALELKA